jgi:hypothetical protein
MKTLMLALSVMLLSTAVFAQSKKAEELVNFKEKVYDFGKIKQGVPVNHDFEFTNVSDKPVVIESATASCGCTTPTWPQAPVAKGKSDKVKAGFNAAAPGAFTKQVTIKVAGAEQPLTVTIKGEVLSADAYAQFEKGKGK